MTLLRLTCCTALLLLLTHCTSPLPADKRDYVGDWEGRGLRLRITGDGDLSYERTEGAVSKSVHAPIRTISTEAITAGVWPFKTVLRINRPPRRYAGQWRMMVDGVELHRGGVELAAPAPEEPAQAGATDEVSPLLAGKSDYIGRWEAPQMTLVIERDASVSQTWTRGGKSFADAPIERFGTSTFLVRVGPGVTLFSIDQPPQREGDVWTMRVNGITLQRRHEAAP